MRRRTQKYPDIVLNLLVAVAISLVVNFSYLLLLIVDRRSDPQPQEERFIERPDTGRLAVHPDGHGYIVYPGGDSVYVTQQRIRRLSLAHGDLLVVDIAPGNNELAHPQLERIRRRNGAEFEYGALFNRPSETVVMVLQLLYYLFVSFVLISILTSIRRHYTRRRFLWGCAGCIAAGVLFYLTAPVTQWPSGRIVANVTSGRILDYVLLLKCSFAVVVSMLYGWVYLLISRQQAVVMENERLKNENLTARYDMLVGQINPHFFFNSLNSLAMLVREGHSEKALTYIDQLSYTFRYIVQNGQNTLITLAEELQFARSYCYLFKIRYADKLFFDIEVDPRYETWTLPALSLQPLIGNAVKHNTITRSHPLHVTIRVADGRIEVSNPKRPKIDPEPSTGIGLENLRNRWLLITGERIEIIDTDERFTVRLPLHQPRTT